MISFSKKILLSVGLLVGITQKVACAESNVNLEHAIISGDLSTTKRLVQAGADVNAYDKYEQKTMLNLAAQIGNYEIFKYLIDSGADVHVKAEGSMDNGTPILNSMIHVAAMGGNVEICKYLVEQRGFDVNAKNSVGISPLFGASLLGKLDVCKYLVQQGSDVYATFKGSSLLYAAFENSCLLPELQAPNGNIEMIKFFIKCGVDMNAQGDDGDTLLHLVAVLEDVNLYKILVSLGADETIKNAKDETPAELLLITQKQKDNLEKLKAVALRAEANNETLGQLLAGQEIGALNVVALAAVVAAAVGVCISLN